MRTFDYLCWFHGEDDGHKRVVEAASLCAAAELYVSGKHAKDALPASDDYTWLVCVALALPGVDQWGHASKWRVAAEMTFKAQVTR